MKKILLLTMLLLVRSTIFAQTYSNLDDTLTGWQNPPCSNLNPPGSFCAGGTGTPSSSPLPSQTINNTWPCSGGDGNTMKLSFVGQAGLPAGQTTNVLWPYKFGVNNAIVYYTGTYNICLPSVTNVQALEFDQFGFHSGTRYMQGSECDSPTLAGGKWRIWNQLAGTWVTTSVACTIITANIQHTVIWQTHIDPTSGTACSGHPCMHYDTLTVDGTPNTLNLVLPAGNSSEPDNNGIQFQIDASSAGGTVTAYLDSMSLTVSTSSPPPQGTGAITVTVTGTGTTTISVTSTGTVTVSASGGTLPLPARTDNCETGVETGCVGGTTTGENGATLAYQNRLPGDLAVMPNFGGRAGETLSQGQCPAGKWNGTSCTSAVNASWTDPDFGATSFRVADANDFPGNYVQTIDNGDGTKGNTNSTLVWLTISNAGNSWLYSFDSYKTLSNGQTNPDYMHSYKTTIGGNNGVFGGTHINFNRSNPLQFYQQVNAGNTALGARLYWGEVQYKDGSGHVCIQTADNFAACQPKAIVSPLDHTTPGEIIRVDFANPSFKDITGKGTSGMLDPNYQTIWSSSAHISDDGNSFSVGLGGGPFWAANHNYAINAQILAHCSGYFQYFAVTSGISGSSSPALCSFTTPGQQFCDNGASLPCTGSIEWQVVSQVGQDSLAANDILNWTIGKGARYINTRIGAVVKADWGDVGALLDGSARQDGTSNGNPLTWVPFDLHELVQLPNATFTSVGWHDCTPNPCTLAGGTTWEIPTRNIRVRNDAQAHGAGGYVYLYNGHHYTRFDGYANQGADAFGLFFPWDQHGTYVNHTLTDSTPIGIATYMTTPAQGVAPFTGAWEGEFLLLRTDGVNSSNPYRIFHQWSTGAAGENFVTQFNFCTVSQDGRFAWCSMDGMKSLGCTDGSLSSYSSPCVIPTNQEGAVTVIDLLSAAAKP